MQRPGNKVSSVAKEKIMTSYLGGGTSYKVEFPGSGAEDVWLRWTARNRNTRNGRLNIGLEQVNHSVDCDVTKKIEVEGLWAGWGDHSRECVQDLDGGVLDQ